MRRIGDDYKVRKKESAEFEAINFMREGLGILLLEKGWVTCISGCGAEFFTFDKKGNRMCDSCKSKPRHNTYQDFDDAYSIVGA